jgi:hypothetical protein
VVDRPQPPQTWTWTAPGGPTPAGSTGAPYGSPSQTLGWTTPRVGAPIQGRAVDLAGAGRLPPTAPGPPTRLRPAAGLGAAPPGQLSPYRVRRGFRACCAWWVTSRRAETPPTLTRSPRRPPLRPRPAPPPRSKAHKEPQQEASYHQGRVSGQPSSHPPTRSAATRHARRVKSRAKITGQERSYCVGNRSLHVHVPRRVRRRAR